MILSCPFVSAPVLCRVPASATNGPGGFDRPGPKFFAEPGVDSGGRVRGSGEWRIGRYRTQGERHVPDHHRPHGHRSAVRRHPFGKVAAANHRRCWSRRRRGPRRCVSFNVGGKMIPLVDFAKLTFVGAVIGGVLLAVLNRRSRSARRRFLQMAVALTALSFVPSVAWADAATNKLALVALHVGAAVIVVPALAPSRPRLTARLRSCSREGDCDYAPVPAVGLFRRAL